MDLSIDFSFRRCQSNDFDFFNSFLWIQGGSTNVANCPTFFRTCTEPPSNWVFPYWFISWACSVNPRMCRTLANALETHRSSPSDCLNCNEGASFTRRLGCCCTCDTLKSPTGMSTKPWCIRFTSDKNFAGRSFKKSSSTFIAFRSPSNITIQYPGTTSLTILFFPPTNFGTHIVDGWTYLNRWIFFKCTMKEFPSVLGTSTKSLTSPRSMTCWMTPLSNWASLIHSSETGIVVSFRVFFRAEDISQ